MNPTISIVVPVYNVEPYIRECIDSIQAQTFKDFELILVNDGSTDASGAICDEYAYEDDRIQAIHKQNGGVSSARNKGIEIAKGEYIGFVDPDDDIEATMYETLVKTADMFKPDMVVCQIKTINLIVGNVSVSSVWQDTYCSIWKKSIEEKIIPSILNKSYLSLLQCTNKLYKKRIFDKSSNRFDETRSHGEDARMNITLLTFIDSLVFINRPLYNYYIRRRNSLTQQLNEGMYDYLVDNKNFGVYLSQKYEKSKYIHAIKNEFSLKSISYMETLAVSTLPTKRKYKLIKQIMNDQDFMKNIKSCNCPSAYYKLLKRICMQKKEELFCKIVRTKIGLQKFFKDKNIPRRFSDTS